MLRVGGAELGAGEGGGKDAAEERVKPHGARGEDRIYSTTVSDSEASLGRTPALGRLRWTWLGGKDLARRLPGHCLDHSGHHYGLSKIHLV